MKKNIFIVFSLIIFYTISLNKCNAQWVQMPNGLGTTKDILRFAVIGNNILAGGEGGLYLTTNNGNNWNNVAPNIPAAQSFAIIGNIIFAGNESGVHLSTNGGINWSQTSFNYFTMSLTSISNYLFAGTLSNGLHYSTNNGTNWNVLIPSLPTIFGLATSGSNIVMGLSATSGIQYSSNFGANWIYTNINNNTIYKLDAFGNNVFAITDYYGAYLSTNNGANFGGIYGNNANAFTMHDSNIFVGTTNSGVYLSTNMGMNWTQKNQGFGTGLILIRDMCISNNYIFAAWMNKSVWRRSYPEILMGIRNISSQIPTLFSLKQNYPNPFNPITKIQFDVMKTENVKITVFDIAGKELEVLVDKRMQPGTYEVEWSGEKYASGIYFYRMQAGDYVETRKMVLMK